MRVRKLVLGAVVAVGAVFGSTLSLSAAAPKVTISSPSNGSTVNSSSMSVKGTFKTDSNVKSVSVVACVLSSAGKCQQYVQNSSGQLSSKWKALNASISTTNNRSGTYNLNLKGLSSSKYQVAVFAADQKNSKGPRAYTRVTVKAGGNDTPPPPAGGNGKGFITILWARSNWQATYGNCQQASGTRTLEQNAQDMKARGLTGVGGVVVARTVETGVSCFNGYTTQASWEKMAMLKRDYNWKFISQGMNYENMTLMNNDSQRIRESLDTLPILQSRGHDSAWGAFNFANNKQDAAAQRIVWKGFSFGRKYGDGHNTKASATNSRIMNTNSINGGRCNNPNLKCYNMRVVNDRRSTSVDIMRDVLNPGANEWGVLQFYRLVEGKRGQIGDSFAWDCTSSSWRDRWTSQPELTCRESFLDALNGRSRSAVNADPASVARAWGVIPSNRQ